MSEKWKSIGKGTVVGEKYKLMRELEPGGGGPVYTAVRKKTKKIVIVSFFSEAAIPNMKAFNRAMRNAKAAFDKRNEFVTIPFDYEFHEGVPYVVYSGATINTLHQLLMGGKKFTRKETKKLGQLLLSPLSTLHKAGIFHLGLSPMSLHRKKSKIQAFDIGVLDFGVTPTRGHDYFTRLADDEQYRCIAAYASPEQAEGNVEADHRTDLYAVGALVYRLLMDRELFDGKDRNEILEKVKSEKPAGLGDDDKDGELTVLQKEFLSRCLEKDPAGRFQTALEMRESFFNAMFEEDDSFPSTEKKKVVKDSGRSPMVFYKVSDDEADRIRMETSSEAPTRELSVEPILQMAKVAAAFEKQVPSEQDRKKETGKEKPIDHKNKVSLPPPPTDREMPSIPPPPPRTSRERILELAKLARETAASKAAASAARHSELDADALEKEGEKLVAEAGLEDKKEEAPSEKKDAAPEKEEEAADRDEAAPEGEEKKGEPEGEEEEKASADGEKPGEEPDKPVPSRKEAETIPATSPVERASASLEPPEKEAVKAGAEKKKIYQRIIIIAIVLAAIAAVVFVVIFKGCEPGESRGEIHPGADRAAREPDTTRPEAGHAAEEDEASASAQHTESAAANPGSEDQEGAQEKTGMQAPAEAAPPEDETNGKKTKKKGPTEDLEFVD